MDRSVLMQSLSSRNLPVRYAALKAMKNAVIGCKTRKSEFLNLGAVERLVYWRFLLVLLMTELHRLVEILSDLNQPPEVLVQSAVILGSLGYGRYL